MIQSFIVEDGRVPRTRAENQRIREEQRARILEAARAVFARRGPSATMADVAAAAEVSQGLAYRYFASKDELFRALIEDAMRTGDGPLISEMPGTPGERLSVLISALVEARRERPEFFQLFDHVLSNESTATDLLELVRRRGGRFVTELRQLIVEGQATGEIAADDPDQLVAAVVAFLDGLTRYAVNHPEQSRHLPDAAIFMRMLLAPGRRTEA
jgi:AcrR family transcriptional regulator